METLYTPVFITSNSEAESYKAKEGVHYVDAFSHQLKELFIIEHPIYSGDRKKEGYATPEFTAFCDAQKTNFVYVYYPWNQSLVKTMPKTEYLQMKTNRNQDLITAEEQKKLETYRVGVFGMSVGSNVAFVLTQAGISNKIILADFDELDTTNLNRILAGAHQISLPKAVIAARRIYEDNPFAEVEIHTEGVTNENLEAMLQEKKLDLIVEEVDSLPVKLKTRELALKYKIPVVMITDNGDGVVLHVERYDLGYDQMFNKPFKHWQDFFSSQPSMQDMGMMIVNDILGGPQNVPPRVFQSVERIMKKELVSWAQLGSAAIFGGVVATVTVKEIALGRNTTPYIEKNIQITL